MYMQIHTHRYEHTKITQDPINVKIWKPVKMSRMGPSKVLLKSKATNGKYFSKLNYRIWEPH